MVLAAGPGLAGESVVADMTQALWGGAECVGTLARSLTEAVAALAFGGSATWSHEYRARRLCRGRRRDEIA
jgi:hypothetical protein